MPWSNQGGGWQGGSGGQGSGGGGNDGGGGGPRGPWGGGKGGGRGQSPDLEDLLRKGQDRIRRVLPGGARSPKAILLILLVLIGVWLLSGFYTVAPDEQGVVLRFGECTRTTQPGLNYLLPGPFESVLTPIVLSVHVSEVAFRSSTVPPLPSSLPLFPLLPSLFLPFSALPPLHLAHLVLEKSIGLQRIQVARHPT